MFAKAASITMAAMLPLLTITTLSAQEIVHATTGKLLQLDPSTSALTIQDAEQTTRTFDVKQANSLQVSFDKSLKEDAEPIDKLSSRGDHVIVYYFGGFKQIAVAAKDLGKKAEDISGKITGVNKNQHTVTVTLKDGSTKTFYIAKDAAVETSMGVVLGSKYSPKKGESISATCTIADGKEVAQFLDPS